MLYAIVWIIGFATGCYIMKFVHLKKRAGNIIVTRDEDGMYFTLNINGTDDIVNKREVILGVISQK